MIKYPALLFSALLIMSCGTTRQTTRAAVDLTGYAGTWYGDDYIEDVDDQGDSIRLGSVLTIDPVGHRIHLECMGPPPMWRIADLDTTFIMTDHAHGRFQFEDSWNNGGEGRIEFRDDEVVVDIAIDKPANSDWQVFEGRVLFKR